MVKDYNLWNPFTNLEEFVPYKDFGPLTIVRGEGAYVYNAAGKRFINASSSLWNVAAGHGRKEITKAAAEQMDNLAYASCFRQTHPKANELATRLCQLTNGFYDKAYLGSNGSEAVETAIKMARQFFRQSDDKALRGKYKILSFTGSYHGVSYGALSSAGLEKNEAFYGPLLDGFISVEPPYSYREAYGRRDKGECERACLDYIREIIEKETPETVAAFIVEPVMGERGVIDPTDGFFDDLAGVCKENGMLFIADEVTTGFGRTGALFASDRWKTKPDILCLGKGVSSGYLPVSATLATKSVYKNFIGDGKSLLHGSTASGHPVCAAAALANIDIILDEKLSENSLETGAYLKSGIERLKEKRPVIGDVRGRGLMIGVELVKSRETREPLDDKEMFGVAADCAALGMAIYYNRNNVGLFPPLIISKSIADDMLEILEKAFDMGVKANMLKKSRMIKEMVAGKTTQ
ncbi:MAG: aspartate aminotransferase family protein [Clostridiales bacterium]|jgi:adenosylmethionine-8-amino-7-oxononanoate aminotransferase|nr:aspartate aminotransferase family protein [Clostridiales bacterium]